MMTIRKNSKGFTLIELAIVLVIIGIIIGAIMKGRDIIRDSQIKEYANSFAGKWVTMLDTYYSKTGQNLVDGSANGATGGGVADGFMDGLHYSVAANRVTLLTALRRAGVEPCNVVKSNLFTDAVTCTADGKNVFQTKVDGEFVSRETTTVGLSNYQLNINGVIQRKNVLVITSLPVDVAIGIDKIYDGTDSGDGGAVINLGGCGAAAADASDAAIVTPANGATIVPVRWPAATGAAGAAGTVCHVGIILEH